MVQIKDTTIFDELVGESKYYQQVKEILNNCTMTAKQLLNGINGQMDGQWGNAMFFQQIAEPIQVLGYEIDSYNYEVLMSMVREKAEGLTL